MDEMDMTYYKAIDQEHEDAKKRLKKLEKEVDASRDRMFNPDVEDFEGARAEYFRVYDEYSDLWDKLDLSYQAMPELKAEGLRMRLETYRPFGLSRGVKKSELISNPRAKVSQKLWEAKDNYPTDWLEMSIKAGPVTTERSIRGFYRGSSGTIGADPDRGLYKTLIHEMGHRFEDVVPGLLEAEQAFHESRTRGEDLVKMADLFPGLGYDDWKETRKDNYVRPYMGREYLDGSREIVSMGMELLFTEPAELIEGDKEMAEWLIGLLVAF